MKCKMEAPQPRNGTLVKSSGLTSIYLDDQVAALSKALVK
jgi:hypothetical protein